MTGIGILAVAAESCHLECLLTGRHGYGSMLYSRRYCSPEKFYHLLRSCIGCNIIIIDRSAYENITNRSTNNPRLMPVLMESLSHLFDIYGNFHIVRLTKVCEDESHSFGKR